MWKIQDRGVAYAYAGCSSRDFFFFANFVLKPSFCVPWKGVMDFDDV